MVFGEGEAMSPRKSTRDAPKRCFSPMHKDSYALLCRMSKQLKREPEDVINMALHVLVAYLVPHTKKKRKTAVFDPAPQAPVKMSQLLKTVLDKAGMEEDEHGNWKQK